MNSNEVPFLQAIRDEEARMAFVLERDGSEALSTFVTRTHNSYCRAMKDFKTMAATREHMHKFFASCVVFETHVSGMNPQVAVLKDPVT